MVKVRFRVVSRVRTDRYRCPCGKRFQRSVRVEQTINPWNLNADGIPKTFAEIWAELGAELARAKTNATHACGQTGVLLAPVVPRLPAESTKDGSR
jgi:hypothetical protein